MTYNQIIDHVNRINALTLEVGGVTELTAYRTAQGYQLCAANGGGLRALSAYMTAGAFNDMLNALENFIIQESRGALND